GAFKCGGGWCTGERSPSDDHRPFLRVSAPPATVGPEHPVMRLLLRIAGPILVTLALLAGLEGVLRLVGFQTPAAPTGDPLLHPLPLFKPVAGADGGAVMQRHDAWGAFRQEKPANGFRVFIIGDSNSFGHPFGPEFAFGRFLQERLAAAMPQRTVEVVHSSLHGIVS